MSDLGYVHLASAWLALGCGLVNLLAPKGTRAHRAIGYCFVFSMLLTNAVALSLYRLSGHFNMFHAFALVSLAATVAALVPVLRRAPGWLVRHQRAMQGAYIGLCAAAMNEILTRMISRIAPLSREAFWFLSVCITLLVILSGAAMARRANRPALAT